MGKLNITLDDDLDKKFRMEVSLRLGFKKGNIQLAITEALKDWIEKINKTNSKVNQ